jgi:hypothetical protein
MAAAACDGLGGGLFGGFPSPGEFSYHSTITVDSWTLEFSGGDFLQSTCTHFVVSDAHSLNEYQINSMTDGGDDAGGAILLQELASYRLQGFSGDYEGICFYQEDNSPMKLAIIDERNRTAALCNFPPAFSNNTIDLESDECLSFSLSPEDLRDESLTSSAPNRGFEGVACDPEDRKLYIVQEKNPMAIWQLDLVTGVFETLIPVSSLSNWRDLVSDLAGVRD